MILLALEYELIFASFIIAAVSLIPFLSKAAVKKEFGASCV